jgi:hypothetical protein
MKRATFMRAALLCCLAAGGPAKAGFTTLDVPTATGGTYAWGIDGRNIVGYYTDGTGDHGFLYNGSSYTTLDDPLAKGFTHAYGISGNNIVGDYFDATGTHGFLYNGSSWTTLDDPLAPGDTAAFGINGNNIVGTYELSTAFEAHRHGFLYDGNSHTTFDDPLATNSGNLSYTEALGISGNNIVGDYADGTTGALQGYFYNGSSFTPLAPFSSLYTSAVGISGNNIVGWYLDGAGSYHGYLYNGST